MAVNPTNVLVTPLYETKGMEESKGFNSFRVNVIPTRPTSNNGMTNDFLFTHNPTSTRPEVGRWNKKQKINVGQQSIPRRKGGAGKFITVKENTSKGCYTANIKPNAAPSITLSPHPIPYSKPASAISAEPSAPQSGNILSSGQPISAKFSSMSIDELNSRIVELAGEKERKEREFRNTLNGDKFKSYKEGLFTAASAELEGAKAALKEKQNAATKAAANAAALKEKQNAAKRSQSGRTNAAASSSTETPQSGTVTRSIIGNDAVAELQQEEQTKAELVAAASTPQEQKSPVSAAATAATAVAAASTPVNKPKLTNIEIQKLTTNVDSAILEVDEAQRRVNGISKYTASDIKNGYITSLAKKKEKLLELESALTSAQRKQGGRRTKRRGYKRSTKRRVKSRSKRRGTKSHSKRSNKRSNKSNRKRGGSYRKKSHITRRNRR